MLAGVYTTPAIYCEVKVVFTNTVPTDAYRGAGRPEATFVLERMVDVAAYELGIDRVEIRRRNFIRKDAFPYQTPVMLQYDGGDHEATLEKALALSGWSSFAERRKQSLARGKLRGIGIVTYVEACGLAPSRIAQQLGARGGLFESANIRVNPSGDVTVFTGAHNHGQGHETVFAQLVGELLGIPSANIEIDPWRHRAQSLRPRHLWLALGRGRRLRHRQGRGQDRRQGQEDRLPPLGGERA